MGEENPETQDIIEKYWGLEEEGLVQFPEANLEFPEELRNLGTLNSDDLCVWIDPLDCTRGFVNNLKYECTILVGVTFKGEPILGIIGQPYKKTKGMPNYKFEPTINIGSIYT